MNDVLVFVGNFQPLHHGHLATMRRALASAPSLIVVLGSARRSRNARHPFTDEERRRMVLEALEDADAGAAGRVRIVAARDDHDDGRWAMAIRREVLALAPAGARIARIGLPPASAHGCPQAFADWPWLEEERWRGHSAAEIRSAYFSPEGLPVAIADAIPPPVLEFLRRFRATPAWQALAEETAEIARGQAAWASAPYPPIFVTVDAVVTCRRQLLLIRRGGHPGRGQWALPGGFVNPDERLEVAAVRELAEETRLGLDPATLRGTVRGHAVFDDPARSVRGRTITHAWWFDLGDRPPPAIEAADDAADARWFRLDALRRMETEIFEDHLLIVERFLGMHPASDATAAHGDPTR